MRDLDERDKIREQYADQPGISQLVERLMGERENAEAYGQDERVAQIIGELKSYGYVTPEARAARKADAKKRAAASEDEGEARKQAPAGRQAAQGKQNTV